MSKPGLYANIHKKRARIKAGSGEKMRKPGEKGAPTKENFERAAKTAKYKPRPIERTETEIEKIAVVIKLAR